MTVVSDNSAIRYNYTGPGDYTFNFKVPEESDLDLYYTDTEGVVTSLAITTDYTVTIVDDEGYCTLLLEETDGHLDIERVLPITQDTEWENNSAFDVEILENDLDRLIMICQQMMTQITVGSGAWLGTWATATSYVTMNYIEGPDGNIYYCLEDHTSGVSFTADLAAGKWVLMLDLEAIATAVEDAEASAAAAALSEAAAEAAEVQTGIDAADSAVNAQNSANCSAAANEAAVGVESYATEAYHWSNYPEDTTVPESLNPPEYSAYHWMKKCTQIAGGGVVSLSGVAPIVLDTTTVDAQNPIISVLGIPAGGTIGQILSKTDGDDYNNEWADAVAITGTTGEIIITNGVVSIDPTYTAAILEAEVMHLQEQQASGTAVQPDRGGGYFTRGLNTEVENSITGASLTADIITLPAGKYRVDADIAFKGVLAQYVRAVIQDDSDDDTLIVGLPVGNTAGERTAGCRGVLDLAAETDIKLVWYVSGTSDIYPGYATNQLPYEVHADLMITKIGA